MNTEEEKLLKELSDLEIKIEKLKQNILHVKIKIAKIGSEFSIGDTISDTFNTIKIDKVKYYHNNDNLLGVIYQGVVMTKKGEPRKDGKRSEIYDTNVITK